MLRIESLHLQNFRCFDKLDVAFEPDLTVLFAENGDGYVSWGIAGSPSVIVK